MATETVTDGRRTRIARAGWLTFAVALTAAVIHQVWILGVMVERGLGGVSASSVQERIWVIAGWMLPLVFVAALVLGLVARRWILVGVSAAGVLTTALIAILRVVESAGI